MTITSWNGQTHANNSAAGKVGFQTDVAVFDDGSYIVVWEGPQFGAGRIVYRLYDAAGDPKRTVQKLSASTNTFDDYDLADLAQLKPTVGGAADGGFAIAFELEGLNRGGEDFTYTVIHFAETRFFNAAGVQTSQDFSAHELASLENSGGSREDPLTLFRVGDETWLSGRFGETEEDPLVRVFDSEII
jgi:hypothetical protein